MNCLNCKKFFENVWQKKFCSRSCSASYNNKLRMPRTEASKKKTSEAILKTLTPELKAKRKITCQKTWELKARRCITCKVKINNENKYEYCQKHWFESEEFKKVLGNYKNYKKGYVYNKYTNSNEYLMSGLEFMYFEYLTFKDIEWVKPKPITYIKDEKARLYFCDFYLPKTNEYIEVKGHWWNNDKIKMQLVKEQNFLLDIKILTLKDIENLHL